jgi:hypothetical protein
MKMDCGLDEKALISDRRSSFRAKSVRMRSQIITVRPKMVQSFCYLPIDFVIAVSENVVTLAIGFLLG